MPIPVTPQIIPVPFAQNGQKNTIPEQGGATTDPAASWSAGFPPITMVNKQAGGKPPYGMDFNGILFTLSQHAFFTQSGCVYPWMGADEDSDFPGLNYLKGAHVLGSDGEEYVALKPSGPDVPASAGGFVGPVDPVGDESGAWAKAASVYAPLATATTPGIVRPDGKTITVNENGVLSAGGGYELCEFYFFRHPTLKPGFQPAQGGLLENAATLYPEAWTYLQTTEGQKLCKTEAEWQAMTQAIWHTNADGTTVGWNGIGGAPFYALHTDTGALRLPDLRGMYAEAAGFDSLGVGDTHGDGIRNITGGVPNEWVKDPGNAGGTGPFYFGQIINTLSTTENASGFKGRFFDSSRAVPTAAKNQTRAWGALACVYLGQPAS